jgi:hypothetical protein
MKSQPLTAVHIVTTASPTSKLHWTSLEHGAWLSRAVYRCAPDAGDAGMAALLASWLQLPQQPVLQHTLAMTLAVYADWLAASLRLNVGAELPPLLLQLLGQGRHCVELVGSSCSLVCRLSRRQHSEAVQVQVLNPKP